MNNKRSLLAMERIFNRMKNKMGQYDYYETNLGMIRYDKNEDGELIEFFDVDYGCYRFFCDDERISFNYTNDMFKISMAKDVDRLFLTHTFVYNDIMVKGLRNKTVLYCGKEIGSFDSRGFVDRDEFLWDDEWYDLVVHDYTDTDKFKDAEIISMGNACVDGVNGRLKNSYSVFLDIMKANNKVRRRKLM